MDMPINSQGNVNSSISVNYEGQVERSDMARSLILVTACLFEEAI